MKWGTFGPVHLLSLLFAVGLIAGLYYLLKPAKKGVQIAVLGILSFSGIAAIVYNLLAWNAPVMYLPLHLCSINALLLPFAVFTRSKTLGNLLLVWSLGALAALVMNQSVAEAELTDWSFVFYYFPHVLEFGIPILLFRLGLVRKDIRCIGSTVVISMGIYTLVHFTNRSINFFCQAEQILYGDSVAQVNYMYSLVPDNPLLQIFYRVIPHQYWYMYMIVPILVVYLLAVYAPQYIRRRKPAEVYK